jgi:hypothetical protein
MSLFTPFVGSPQSRYAALALIIAISVVSLSILLGADAMPLSQKFFFVILIFLLSIPGLLLSLLQLTCLVTGEGVNHKRWWCWGYSWLMSLFIIFYSIVIIIIAVRSLVINKETFTYRNNTRQNSNNIIIDYPAQYPPNVTPAPEEYPTLANTETGLPTNNESKYQYMIREQSNERFIGMADDEAFNQNIERFANKRGPANCGATCQALRSACGEPLNPMPASQASCRAEYISAHTQNIAGPQQAIVNPEQNPYAAGPELVGGVQ